MKTILLSLSLVPLLAVTSHAANKAVTAHAAPRRVDLGDITPSRLNGMHIKVARGGIVTGNVLGSGGLVQVKGNSIIKRGSEVGLIKQPQRNGLWGRLTGRTRGATTTRESGARFSIAPLGLPVHGALKYETVKASVVGEGTPVHFTIEPVGP
jgi:hypothetical protein